MKLYVGNLSFESTENDLQDLFEQHGQVSEVRLMMDRMTGKSRGFAFVTMNDNAQASAAVPDVTPSVCRTPSRSASSCSKVSALCSRFGP